MTESTPTRSARILIVEDETLFASTVRKRLNRAGYHCEVVADLHNAHEYLAHSMPDLILLDMRLPDGSGLDFIHDRRSREQQTPNFIVMTAFGEIDDAVTAMKYGALDFLQKPIDLDVLLLALENCLAQQGAKTRHGAHGKKHHTGDAPSLLGSSSDLIGNSSKMTAVRQNIERIALLSSKSNTTPPTVLILGETGTGKDLAAHCIHDASNRAKRPFVHVDCAVLPKDLIESELFGHEKGAFTSAHSQRTGLLEMAQDGTVYLDEIAELPLELQSKLLAVLERRVLRPVGSSRERAVHAWFIAATNRDLRQMITQGKFRSDLYFRLEVLTLTMPTLRERGDDVIPLAKHYSEQAALRYGLMAPVFDPDALAALAAYDWPGNVRELTNVIERAVLLSAGRPLSAQTLSLDLKKGHSNRPQRSESLTPITLESAEAALIRQALERTHGNVSEAARQLGISRMTLRYRMQKYAITAGR